MVVGATSPAPAEVVRAAADSPDSGSDQYLESLRPGLAEGPLFGGNLALLHACAAAGGCASGAFTENWKASGSRRRHAPVPAWA